MTGYCIIGTLPKTHQEMIISKVGRFSVTTTGFTTPKEFNWKLREVNKLCLSQDICQKRLEKLKAGEFIKLFEQVEIKQIKVDEEKNIIIV